MTVRRRRCRRGDAGGCSVADRRLGGGGASPSVSRRLPWATDTHPPASARAWSTPGLVTTFGT